MRQIIGFAIGFLALYVVWQVFWRSAFAVWDNANAPIVPLILLAGCAAVALYYWKRLRKRN